MVDIHTIEWAPGCGCVIFYEYDNDLPLAQQVLTGTAVGQRCVNHPINANTPTANDHYNQVLQEHKYWNITLGAALDNLTTQLAQADPISGALSLKPGITLNFVFSGTFPNRVCTISFTGVTLTNQQKNTLQNKANQFFGAGKVIIQ